MKNFIHLFFHFNGKFTQLWLMLLWIELLLTDSFSLNPGFKEIDKVIKLSEVIYYEVIHGFWTVLYHSTSWNIWGNVFDKIKFSNTCGKRLSAWQLKLHIEYANKIKFLMSPISWCKGPTKCVRILGYYLQSKKTSAILKCKIFMFAPLKNTNIFLFLATWALQFYSKTCTVHFNDCPHSKYCFASFSYWHFRSLAAIIFINALHFYPFLHIYTNIIVFVRIWGENK